MKGRKYLDVEALEDLHCLSIVFCGGSLANQFKIGVPHELKAHKDTLQAYFLPCSRSSGCFATVSLRL